VRHAPPLPSHLLLCSSVFSSFFSYVGNKASNFPLQLLGFDVDPLHSCQLSNHTGYAHVAGLKTSAKDVRDIAAGLDKNNMLRHYSHLLTGYMTSVEFLEECVTLIQRMRKDNPNIFFGQCKHHSLFLLSILSLVFLFLPFFSFLFVSRDDIYQLINFRSTDLLALWRLTMPFRTRAENVALLTDAKQIHFLLISFIHSSFLSIFECGP